MRKNDGLTLAVKAVFPGLYYRIALQKLASITTLVVVLVAGVPLRGYVFQQLWNWFIDPRSSLGTISLGWAIGVLWLSWLMSLPVMKEEVAQAKKPAATIDDVQRELRRRKRELARLLILTVIKPLVLLGIGWVLHTQHIL